uniref:Uncharacterized protein n=1 Tax=Monopterus albus TaxID=43700 RepID=A0A3Q3QUR9_MONAL
LSLVGSGLASINLMLTSTVLLRQDTSRMCTWFQVSFRAFCCVKLQSQWKAGSFLS